MANTGLIQFITVYLLIGILFIGTAFLRSKRIQAMMGQGGCIAPIVVVLFMLIGVLGWLPLTITTLYGMIKEKVKNEPEK
jgi:hypothetical protein